ncbi:MAG: gamma-glutamyl-gamma-aminobutyrate hydrolase family protein [Saprospiraceae bacterium]|nr:gamma-glutamyl-gamma-aminobutyrate hydrolase family protein [Saprospiraceae bacterium]
MIKIGVASAFMYPDLNRAVFGKKTLCYIEKDMANYISKYNVQPILIPDLTNKNERNAFLNQMDAFVFQGGNDIAPEMYGESPINNGQWKGDPYRDEYELEIMDFAIKNNFPVFGICRGMQLLNVYFGGNLYQDIITQKPNAILHRDANKYDQLIHSIDIQEHSILFKLTKTNKAYVNSVHHQGVKDVGKDISVLANCTDDQIVETIQWNGAPEGKVIGVQWHPEFFYNSSTPLFQTDLLFEHFLSYINK